MYTYRWRSQINSTRTFGIFRIPKLEHFISLSLNEFLWISHWNFFVLDCVALLSGVRTKHLFDSYFSNSILEYNLIYCKCNANTIPKRMNAKTTEKDTETKRYWQSLLSFPSTDWNSMYRPVRNLILHKKIWKSDKFTVLSKKIIGRGWICRPAQTFQLRYSRSGTDASKYMYASPRASTSNETFIQYNKMHIETSSFIHIAYVILL